jgi:hypothetical protein
MQYRKTPSAAKEAGIRYSHLVSLLRTGKLAPPQRDDSGDYIWGPDDIERIRQAARIGRRRQEVPA